MLGPRLLEQVPAVPWEADRGNLREHE
jgi:hypothetical protein